jgi:hypothetical protein
VGAVSLSALNHLKDAVRGLRSNIYIFNEYSLCSRSVSTLTYIKKYF